MLPLALPAFVDNLNTHSTGSKGEMEYCVPYEVGHLPLADDVFVVRECIGDPCVQSYRFVPEAVQLVPSTRYLAHTGRLEGILR